MCLSYSKIDLMNMKGLLIMPIDARRPKWNNVRFVEYERWTRLIEERNAGII